jgi:chorismate mutase/prephenate dehydrogenase
MDEDLDAVRRRIGEIDGDLVRLVAERVRLAREVGEIKRSQNLPTVDYAQERRVLEQARLAAEEGGLDPAVAEDVLARLIRASVTAQEEDSLRFAATGAGARAVVIGGAGRMGGWITRFLGNQGYAVAVLDPNVSEEERRRAEEWLATAELVLCATPPRATVQWYRRFQAAVPAGVVADLASIKSPLLEPIRDLQRAGGRVASMHPMFGPSTVLLRDADLLICETGDAEATQVLEALFRPTTVEIVRIPLVDHDRLMADLLSLAHATAIAFALALPETGHPVRSTSFQALKKLAATVTRESPAVYYEIQAENPHSLAAVERLRAAVEDLLVVVRARSPEDFKALMAEGKRRTEGR